MYAANKARKVTALEIWKSLTKYSSSLVVQIVKHLPTMQKTRVQSLGQEDPLEKEMATHSSTLAWKIPWMEEPGGLQSVGSQRVRHDWVTSLHSLQNTHFMYINSWRWRPRSPTLQADSLPAEPPGKPSSWKRQVFVLYQNLGFEDGGKFFFFLNLFLLVGG